MTAIANPVPAKEIVYDRETRDYAMYLDGQCVGYARSYHEAETELDRIVYEQLRHTPSRNPNPNPSFEEEIEAPARASEIFNTYQINWQGAIVLARAEEQSKNDAKALAIVEYVIKHYHEIRTVANGVMVPSDSQEDGHLAALRKELAQTFQERDVLQRQLATLEIRVQAQRGALATALARCDELQALADAHKSEADNLQSAFEIAYKRREQLHNDNVDLSTAVVDLNHINGLLAMRLTQVLELFDAHDLLWEIRDEVSARAAREIVEAARELVGKV